MESFDSIEVCPKCGRRGLKDWSDLSDDERLLVERLPASAEFTREQRKKHLFCSGCWYETQDAAVHA